jgi:hypothetical protein
MRAVPLLMIFSLVLFLNVEMWQVFSSLPGPFLAVAAGLFVMLGILFLAARIPGEVRRLEEEASELGPPLRQVQRLNVGLVIFVSHALQVLVVSAFIGLFFVVFGALVIGEGIRESWIGEPGRLLLELHLFGHPVQVTEELLRVSGGIAAFTGLYYAIAMLIDSAYRDQFLGEITDQMRATFVARGEYLKLAAAAHPAGSTRYAVGRPS